MGSEVMTRRSLVAGCTLLLSVAACTNGPTATSPLGEPSLAPTALELATESAVVEQFNCSLVDEVFVRFSDPGFLDGSHVGLYVNFTGVPAGEQLLRLWWNYDDAFEETEDVPLDDASLDRIGGRLVFERVFEHVYAPVVQETSRKVRVELILLGKTGNCARNRTIVLRPDGRTTEESPRELPCSGGPCTVFVTSLRYPGDLGGLAGADAKCQERALSADLAGRFRAWLSDGADSPASRFSRPATPYQLVDGTAVASGWTDLVKGTIAHHIDVTEAGMPAGGVSTVWTRTRPNGTAADFALGPDCEGWTSASTSGFGTNGQYQGQLGLWSFIGASSCNASLRLYCFQQ